MSMSAVRTFYYDKIQDALDTISDTTTTITKEGDTTSPSANDTRVRLKLLPVETDNAGIGVNRIQLLSGLVQMDVIGPRRLGLDNISRIAESLIDTIAPGTAALGDDRLVTYVVWEEAVIEEPAHLRIPVIVRWQVIH